MPSLAKTNQSWRRAIFNVISRPVSSCQCQLDFNLVFIAALVIRLIILIYGMWQDAHFRNKYTDIDYEIITDGARYLWLGKSPYNRPTYRYTPLLALVLTPNIFWFKNFGKLLFISMDMVAGYFIYHILKHLINAEDKLKSSSDVNHKALFFSCFWLFNPAPINLATRGSPESIVCTLVLSTLYLLIVRKSRVIGGMIYALSIHFKFFPIIYSLAFFLYVGHFVQIPTNSPLYGAIRDAKNKIGQSGCDDRKLNQFNRSHRIGQELNFFKLFLNPDCLIFTFSTILTLSVLSLAFYAVYGWDFLHETYIYHIFRKDIRHNLSVYFYFIYLNSATAQVMGLTTALANKSWDLFSKYLVTHFLGYVMDFGPQIVLLLVITFQYYKDITFCTFLMSMAFVFYNKVCTLQNFVWYLSLLAIILPWSQMKISHLLILTSMFASALGLWFHYGYRLEFLGQNVFFQLWISGLILFTVNIITLNTFIFFQSPKKNKTSNSD